MTTTFLPTVPQVFVDVDRDKVLKQGVDIGEVYQTLQAFMGGDFVNYFNRFGRQWQVYVQAEGEYRTDAEGPGPVLRAQQRTATRAALSALTSIEQRSGPEFTMRYNLYRSAQINAAAPPGYSSAQAMKALEEVFAQTMPPEMGYDYLGMSFQEKKAQEGVPAWRDLRPVAAVRFSDPGGALRKLVAALQRASGHAHRGLRGLRGALCLRSMEQQCLCPDRPGHADRPGRQKRHPHRRVRQGGIRERQDRSPMPPWKGARLRLRPILMTSFAFILGCMPLWPWPRARAPSPGRSWAPR